MSIAFTILLLIHGVIHIFGFLKAFQIGEMPQLTQELGKLTGIFCLLTTASFLFTAFVYLLNLL